MGLGVCDRVIAVENELQDLLFLFFFFFFDLPNFLSPLKLRHFMIPTWSSTKRVSGGAVKQPPPFSPNFFFLFGFGRGEKVLYNLAEKLSMSAKI
jgi:hypothetical protein